MANMRMVVKDKKDLSDFEIKGIAELLMATWPPEDDTTTLNSVIEFYKNGHKCSVNKVFLYYNDEAIIGHTEIFDREIIIESEKIEIMALAAVCVSKAYRGQQIGAELVKKAFSFVNNKQFKSSVFQTNVPGFYEKLGCKKIYNTFINSKSKTDIHKNPWRDPHVMVYPESFNTGNSIIDLNGECY